MWNTILEIGEWADNVFWSYIGFTLIMGAGIWLSIKARFMQIFSLPFLFKLAFSHKKENSTASKKAGIHPFKLFCASIGGTVGIGNLTGVIIAVAIGGPGAVLWVWIAGILGTIVKYAEVFLGMKYRIKSPDGTFFGGPMFFLKKAFKNPWIPTLAAILLSIYSIEVFQFSVIVNTFTENFMINHLLVTFILLSLVLYMVIGGIERVANLCSIIIPLFTVGYILTGAIIMLKEIAAMPALLALIFKTAFTGHAVVGGFLGSSMFMAIRQGLSRAAYSGDIGVGFDAVIQTESTAPAKKQATLGIFSLIIDNLMCTVSLFIILLSGLWKAPGNDFNLFQRALSQYIPYTRFFVPLLIFVTGYTTITSYFTVGIKCAYYLYPKWGKQIYFVYGSIMLIIFSFVNQRSALLLMSLAGGALLLINLSGVFILRNEIEFPNKKDLL
ncbi:amino acid carrier protein [Candidatus Clavichlamydia salmonicola]|uniref:amino acid carrier protein n=1 Tax=Candidatus Clavichlamydia salmonicola TaxID=469812 RepID=UPI001890B863|nr:amino acid carrier protein [Candidatus Clavichlamydia salmonicola]